MAKYFLPINLTQELLMDNGVKIPNRSSYISYFNMVFLITLVSFIQNRYPAPTMDKMLQMEDSLIEYGADKLKKGKILATHFVEKTIKVLSKKSTITLEVIQNISESQMSLLLINLFEELTSQGEDKIYIDVQRNSFGMVTKIVIQGIKYEDTIDHIKNTIINVPQLKLID